MQIYQLLFDRYGPQKWWPAEDCFEIMVGAILTQNTNWTNVEKAIANLKAADCLSPRKIDNLDTNRLAQIIRPAGYYNIKAKRLKNYVHFFCRKFNADLALIKETPLHTLRPALLSVSGIGPETADSILLYALDKCVFVVDAYTCRILARHELIEPHIEYEQLRELFENNLPQDIRLYNEFHALLVRAGKEYCRPRPRCADCPLESLPHQTDF